MNNLQYRIPNEHMKLEQVHPTAKFGKGVVLGIGVVVSKNVIIGDNCFIGHYSFIRHDAKIGNNVTIRYGCLIDPDVVIGDGVSVHPMAIIAAGTIVGDMVHFGAKACSINTNKFGLHRNRKSDYLPNVIKRGAIIAAGARLKGGVTVGENSLVGFGSIVTKDVPDNEIWIGVPAKKMGDVAEEDRVIYNQEKVSEGLANYSDEINKLPHPYSEFPEESEGLFD